MQSRPWIWLAPAWLIAAPLAGQTAAQQAPAPAGDTAPPAQAASAAPDAQLSSVPAATPVSPLQAEAESAPGMKLLVSVGERTLRLMDGRITLYSAPVAVGKPVVMEYEGREWNFGTPVGRHRIIGKERSPVWIPPDWHYVELALKLGMQLEFVKRGQKIPLSDGSHVTVRGRSIGRLLPDGKFVPVPEGDEAVFEDTLFAPPTGTVNRRIPGELGKYKLDFGDGYYLHGTPYRDSIGSETTHGCVRLREQDLEFLYRHVPVGTRVYVY